MPSATLASISNCLHDIMMQQAASRIQRVVQAPINTSMSIKHETNELIYTFRNVRLKLRKKQTTAVEEQQQQDFFQLPDSSRFTKMSNRYFTKIVILQFYRNRR